MKQGRNEKCECSSGLKYKNCCLDNDRAAELNNKHNISGSSNPFQALGVEFDALLDLTGSTPLFFTNPNKDGGVKGTPLLNKISKVFREKHLPKLDASKITEGFELNPAVFKWEWIMDAYNSRVVFRENKEENVIDVWFYPRKEDHKALFEYGLIWKDIDTFMINVVGIVHTAESIADPKNKNKKLKLHKAM